MATILFLGASISQLAAIRRAKELGHTVAAVDADAGAPGFALADVAEPISFSDVERVVELGRRANIAAVIAVGSDRAVPAAAAIAERLDLPGIGSETAHVMTDKMAMRERLRDHSVPQPAFVGLSVDSDAVAACRAVGMPAVCKPVDSGGQRGLFMISDASTLKELLPQTLLHSNTRRAILEQFVDGDELNGIVVVRDGEPRLLTLSDRLRPPGAGFGVGWAHLYPSGLPQAFLDAAERVALDAVRALGLRDGIAFPQLIVTRAGEVLVVEVAARVPAGQMADLVRLGIGVNLIDIALTQALGHPITGDTLAPRFQRPLAIRFLTANPGILPTGAVTAIDNLDRVLASPGVVEASLYIEIGETIKPVQVDADRRGYVIATADNPGNALQLALDACKHLRVRVAQPHRPAAEPSPN